MSSARDASGWNLNQLQRWFLEHIVGPHRQRSTPESIAQRDVETVLLPSKTLTAEQRMQVYAQQYLWRLLSVAGNEHPVVKRLMGEEAFDSMVVEYLDRYPPYGHSLDDLCHALPYFLQYRCARDDAPLLYQVARAENALSNAHHIHRLGTVTAENLSNVPQELWPVLRFHPDPSLQLMAFDYNVLDIIDAHKEGQPLPALDPISTWGAVWRHDHKVWHQRISRPRYAALSALVDGETVTVALERASDVWEDDDDTLVSTVFQWFSEWIEEELFSSLILPSS